ncbi:MAG: coproporphyrinogen-III oxidase family protein, partial [Nitrospinaceae bacterium]
ALPGQSLQLWESHLDQALALTPDHLSCYNLTIEPGTSFYRLQGQGKLKIPGEESQLDHFRTTITKLTQAGFKHYEISNFARPGRECRHNRNYWENGEYWGIGAGSSSYLDGVRRRNVKSPDQYVRQIKNRGNASAFEEKLEPRQAMGETLMLGLRLQDGLSLARFEQRFKIPFDQAFGGAAARLLNLNLITLEGGRVALSEKGLYLADSVILEFIE